MAEFLTFDDLFGLLDVTLKSRDVLAYVNTRLDLPSENVGLVHEQDDDDLRQKLVADDVFPQQKRVLLEAFVVSADPDSRNVTRGLLRGPRSPRGITSKSHAPACSSAFDLQMLVDTRQRR